jgi:hypothetical protein
MRYWAVKFFAELIVAVGGLLMLPGIVFTIMIALRLGNPGPPLTEQLIAFAVSITAVLAGLPFIALGQLLKILLAIEVNTRKEKAATM